MNKSIMTKWVRALRSDDYTQAQEALKVRTSKGHNHCCLGVLCDILDKGKWLGKQGAGYIEYGIEEDKSISKLPKFITKEAEMDIAGNGSFNPEKVKTNMLSTTKYYGDKSKNLWELNDAGNTFEEIANFIQVNYKFL